LKLFGRSEPAVHLTQVLFRRSHHTSFRPSKTALVPPSLL